MEIFFNGSENKKYGYGHVSGCSIQDWNSLQKYKPINYNNYIFKEFTTMSESKHNYNIGNGSVSDEYDDPNNWTGV